MVDNKTCSTCKESLLESWAVLRFTEVLKIKINVGLRFSQKTQVGTYDHFIQDTVYSQPFITGCICLVQQKNYNNVIRIMVK